MALLLCPFFAFFFLPFLFSPFFIANGQIFAMPKTTKNKSKTNGPMHCFYCRHSNKAHKDLSDPLIERAECLSPELFANKSQFQRQCATHETFCMTAVSSMNGFFVEMRRDCAERCRPGCQESGYGLFSRQCARCCRSSLCNHFDGRNFLLNDDSAVQQLSGPEEGFSFGAADEHAKVDKRVIEKKNGAMGKGTGERIGGGPILAIIWAMLLSLISPFVLLNGGIIISDCFLYLPLLV